MSPDAVARLVLDEAGPLSGTIGVLDDMDAHLTHALLDAGCQVRAWCDDIRDADALPPNVRVGRPDEVDADVVLGRLPAGLGALEDRVQAITASGREARLVAGGRVKHMTMGQNDVLGRYFGRVRASLGRDRCRVLEASDVIADAAPRWPKRRDLPEWGLSVWSHGSVFAGGRLDPGTELLLRALVGSYPSRHPPVHPPRGEEPPVLNSARRARAADINTASELRGRALDLGCGSGILASWLAKRGWATSASDVSWFALDATQRTAEANGVQVETHWRDGLRGAASGSFDLIVTNPPFHRGSTKDSTPTLDAIADAGRVLAPGGEFWCVFNSHLPYLRALADAVGSTRIVARDRSYTVTRSVRRAG